MIKEVASLFSSPWFAGPVAILAIVLAMIFYFKSKREKIPRFAINIFELLRPPTQIIPGLTVSIEGKQVEWLTLARVAIWNAGSNTINGEDISPRDPLRITLEETAEFVGVPELKYQSTVANGVALGLSEDRRSIFLTLDFIDKNQGAIVQCLHTGGEACRLSIRGTIKGARQLRVFSDWAQDAVFTAALSLGMLPFLLYSVLSLLPLKTSSETSTEEGSQSAGRVTRDPLLVLEDSLDWLIRIDGEHLSDSARKQLGALRDSARNQFFQFVMNNSKDELEYFYYGESIRSEIDSINWTLRIKGNSLSTGHIQTLVENRDRAESRLAAHYNSSLPSVPEKKGSLFGKITQIAGFILLPSVVFAFVGEYFRRRRRPKWVAQIYRDM